MRSRAKNGRLNRPSTNRARFAAANLYEVQSWRWRARDQWTRRVTGSTCSGQFSSADVLWTGLCTRPHHACFDHTVDQMTRALSCADNDKLRRWCCIAAAAEKLPNSNYSTAEHLMDVRNDETTQALRTHWKALTRSRADHFSKTAFELWPWNFRPWQWNCELDIDRVNEPHQQ